MITVDKLPSTPEGQAIAEDVVEIAIKHADTVSPCEFLAWEGELFGRKIKVSVVEPEENTKLCGPAALNEIVVHKQNIMGIPHTSRWEDAFLEGVTTGIRYIDSFAALAAYEIEVATMAGKVLQKVSTLHTAIGSSSYTPPAALRASVRLNSMASASVTRRDSISASLEASWQLTPGTSSIQPIHHPSSCFTTAV